MIETTALILGIISSYIIISTLTILWKANPFYISAESTLRGTAGAVSILTAMNQIYSNLQIATGGNWIRVLPIVIGLLLFSTLTKMKWAARYPQLIITGIGLGVMVGLTIRAQIINQLILTITSLTTAKTPVDAFTGILILLGVVGGIYYFVYAFQPKGALKKVAIISSIGLMYMGVTLGNAWAVHTISFLSSASGVLAVVRDFILSLLR
jgi:hypothetical protein